MRDFKYPKSFPNKEEELFLKLLLSSDNDFLFLWNKWKANIIFEEINYATLKLLPLLYARLKNFDINDDIKGRIKGTYKLIWYGNQFVLNSTKNLIYLLNKENIPVILLKGVALINNVYKDSGVRFVGDADILIDPKNIKRVIEVMTKNNWRYSDSSSFYANRFLNIFSNKVDKEIHFIDNRDVTIDLHWSLFPFIFKENKEHPMSYGEVIKHAIDCDMNGAKYKMPCMEDMIIHIVIHGAERSSFRALRWVVDVAYIIREKSIDWNFLLKRIKEFGVPVELNVAFSYLLNNNFVSIPESFIENLQNIPMSDTEIKEYYRKANTIEKSLFGTLPYLWTRYWRYDKKGSIFTSWYYFIDYICQSWGITKKRRIPLFIFEKYQKRIKMLLHK